MIANDEALICKALSDSNRIQIVELLNEGEQFKCHLLEHFQISQPTLTHRMRVLSECGLLRSRKDGKWNLYSLNCETLQAFREFITKLDCSKAARAVNDKCCE